MNSNKPRPVTVILQDALEEVKCRGEYLEGLAGKLEDEQQAVTQAAVALRGLVEPARVALSADPAPLPAPVKDRNEYVPRSRGDKRLAILECLTTSIDMLTREQIAESIDFNGRGLSIVLGQMRTRGDIVLEGNQYGLPSRVSTSS